MRGAGMRLWNWWHSRHDSDTHTLRDLEHLADRVYAEVRSGAHCDLPATGVHRQVVEEMGGSHWWQALQDDFDRMAGPR